MSDEAPELPPGVTPEFAAENQGPLIVTTISILTGVALIFVIARLYSRKISVGKYGVDDWLCIVSMILGLMYVGIASVAIENGGGRHIIVLTPKQRMNAIYYTLVSFVPGVLSFTVPKFAVLVLVAKILHPSNIHRFIMWIVSACYSLLAIGMLIVNFGQCSPAAKQWGAAEGTCWDRRITVNYAIVLGVASVVFDFYLALYPTYVLTRLQMNWKKKLALSSSLGFGYCAGAVAIYKCTTLPGLLNLTDFTYSVDDVVLWTNIEANCVLIGACIPTLYPLVKKIFGSAALGGSTPNGEKGTPGVSPKHNDGLITFGQLGGRRKKKSGLTTLGTLGTMATRGGGDDATGSRDVILEERPPMASSHSGPSGRVSGSGSGTVDGTTVGKDEESRIGGY